LLLRHLWLTDFRNYDEAHFEPAPGLTVVLGANAQGKTNLLEAIGWLATTSSFRGTTDDALVRQGAACAVVRAEGEREGRELLLEAEIRPGGRDRVLVNRQPLKRARDLLGALRVSVFSPDDLALVKAGPSGRRGYLDDGLVALHPRNDALLGDLERVLRQRNALLKQSGGRATPEIVSTLDVWDAKLAVAGEAVAAARADLVARIQPELAKAYAGLVAGSERSEVSAIYRAPWSEADGGPGLAGSLAAGRDDDLRRGVSLVGPHRDELELAIGGMPARTHASQGEQRSVALALRLAMHQVVRDAVGEPPVLLLDDVFSELDDARGAALVAMMPSGQAILTTATELPPGAHAERVIRVVAGRLQGT
jgi:DNA replication and repair protein RecF